MIPKFNKDGNLPSGIHEATLEEIEKRFAVNYIRKEHFHHLKILINDLKSIKCNTIYIDGSFITEKILPNDIDVCWDNTSVNLADVRTLMPILWDFSSYGRRMQQTKYHADVFPANIMESSSKKLFLDFFQHDKKTGAAKGIIKLEI